MPTIVIVCFCLLASLFVVYLTLSIVEIDVGGEKIWWFGGGADLTPHYLFEEVRFLVL
jgi:coproporphyrinogen III oxidase